MVKCDKRAVGFVIHVFHPNFTYVFQNPGWYFNPDPNTYYGNCGDIGDKYWTRYCLECAVERGLIW